MYTILILVGLGACCWWVGKSHLQMPSYHQHPERERLRLENAYMEEHTPKANTWATWGYIFLGLATLRLVFWAQGM